MVGSLAVIDLPAALARLHRDHPGITIRLTHTAAPALARAVADAELDIAFSMTRSVQPG
jgi:DNA-binding transcriptional LysR family regulator